MSPKALAPLGRRWIDIQLLLHNELGIAIIKSRGYYIAYPVCGYQGPWLEVFNKKYIQSKIGYKQVIKKVIESLNDPIFKQK